MNMESRAKLRLARVSARKARLVADLIRGREVGEALEILQFTRKKTAPLLKNLVESAVANAEFKAERDGGKVDIDSLVVKQVFVDEGPTLRRFRPRARGMATKILKRTSHITIVLGEA
jgi:large subunit ribosomal protein L22